MANNTKDKKDNVVLNAGFGSADFPMAGTVIGAMVGYLASSILYRASIDLIHDAVASDEKRRLIKALASEAIQSMRQQ